MTSQPSRISLAALVGVIACVGLISSPVETHAQVRSKEFKDKNGKKNTFLWIDRNDDNIPEAIMLTGPNGTEIRVDKNGDGLVDLVEIESGGYEIKQMNPVGTHFAKMQVVKREPNHKVIATFFLSADFKRYDLWQIETAPYETRFKEDHANRSNSTLVPPADQLSEFDRQLCEIYQPSNSNLQKWWEGFSKKSEEDFLNSRVMRSLVDKSCSADESKIILKSFANTILEGRGPESEERSVEKYYSCAAKISHLPNDFSSDALMLKQWKLIREGKSSVFKCSDLNGKSSAFSEADKAVVLDMRSLRTENRVTKAIFHEALHFNLPQGQEELVKKIEDCCTQGYDPNSKVCSPTVLNSDLAQKEELKDLLELVKLENPDRSIEIQDGILELIVEGAKGMTCEAPKDCQQEYLASRNVLFDKIEKDICPKFSAPDKCHSVLAELKKDVPSDIVKSCSGSEVAAPSKCLFLPRKDSGFLVKMMASTNSSGEKSAVDLSRAPVEPVSESKTNGPNYVPRQMGYAPGDGSNLETARKQFATSQPGVIESIKQTVATRLKDIGPVSTAHAVTKTSAPVVLPAVTSRPSSSSSRFGNVATYIEKMSSEGIPVLVFASGKRAQVSIPNFTLRAPTPARNIASTGSRTHESKVRNSPTNSKDPSLNLMNNSIEAESATLSDGSRNGSIEGSSPHGKSGPAALSNSNLRTTTHFAKSASGGAVDSGESVSSVLPRIPTASEIFELLKHAERVPVLVRDLNFIKGLENSKIAIYDGPRKYGYQGDDAITKLNYQDLVRGKH